MACPSGSQLRNTCGNLVSGSNTGGAPLPQTSLPGPTTERADADRAGPSPPLRRRRRRQRPGRRIGPVAAPPLAVTTAMEEDADPAVIAPSEVVASMVRARTPPLDPAVPQRSSTAVSRPPVVVSVQLVRVAWEELLVR